MAQLRIHTLPLLKLQNPPGSKMYLSDIAEPEWMTAYIWYIEGADQRILVDAGAGADTMLSQGLHVEVVSSPEDALKGVGITPDDVDLIISTHLHVDHAEAGQIYKNARFIIQKTELDAALKPHPVEAQFYTPRETLDGLDMELIDGDTQVNADLRILYTPGHSRGGQSLLIKTERGKVIISGLCSYRKNFLPPEAVAKSRPVIPPAIHLDVRQAFDSLMRIKEEADIIIPLHDTELVLREAA